ncbi:HNH endonuclease [Janthinobacterium sp. 17J80-10]|uniref:HNH endonuclease n=1 Tax=Janthinobacterium sp. 17J80-10 TaxID=2497863 RepID=UPI0019D6E9A7|nr:HNH endonuclease [Janthinobacterium sp. 17J80-10]
MAEKHQGWTRRQLLIAFYLYCQMPFGKVHSKNADIIKFAALIGRTPSALAMKLTNIASLDPAITSTGRNGLTSASASDKRMWEEMQQNWEYFALESQAEVDALLPTADAMERDLTSQPLDSADGELAENYVGSEKLTQVKIRIGQNFFRRSVMSAYQNRCCITGLSHPRLLVASHILPWRQDANNRLNPRNGLCLSALHDRAFDQGLITITTEFSGESIQRNQNRRKHSFFL